ncbi:MAG: AAA family ATPase [Firmicutes bacterium]|nr:AAA family ATPase [Bacillota bacterium]
MFFKRLELNGFKSFADPVTIEFTDGITCIVGPNGSGKSNISDAIRWVLGEQSPKMLRGGKMEEVIFAGTQNRKAKGMAEVTLVIDNSDHMLPIDYSEVAITRRMYRSGESEYLINKNICRLRDIRELIMDTGIGVEGYSVIGQGKIADIVSNKMDSRREIFEEAAGVVKYRSRKAEAERKLDAAVIDLSRVNDIIGEIEGRIDKLKEDSEKAEEYLSIKDKAADVEINIILKQIEQADQKGSAVKEEIEELAKAMDAAEKEKTASEESLRDMRIRGKDLEDKLVMLRSDLARCIDEVHELSARDSVNKEKRVSLDNEVKRLEGEISDTDSKINRERANAEEMARTVSSAAAECEELKTKLQEKQKEAQQAEKSQLEAETLLEKASYELERLKVERGKLSARINLLEELERSYEGYNGAVKYLMDKKLKGIIGTLGDLLIVPRGYELAIETELGGKLQNIVCKDDDVASKAIEMLKRDKAGRLTFLPVDNMKVQPPLPVDRFKGKKGFIGLASELVKCEGGYQDIVDYVLGNVVLCDKLDNALAMSASSDGPHKFVTLEGEIINMAGALTGGSLKNNSSNILTRRAEKEDLIKQLEDLDRDLSEASKAKEDAQAAFTGAGAGRAKEEEMQIRMELNSSSLRLQNAKDVESLVRTGIDELVKERKSREKSLESARLQIEQIEEFTKAASSLLAEKEAEKASADEKLSKAQVEKDSISDSIEKMENENGVLQEKVYELQLKKHDAELRQTRFDTQTESLKDKLWEEFEMSYAQAAEHEDPDFVLSRALRESREYKERLREIGDVNVGAIEEYKAVSERYGFLTSQRDDIQKAMDELRKVISDMDRIIKARFKENFDTVVVNFEETFKELFKGGHARLTLEDPDNPLESAIEIEAQPPGKKLQNMNLLSGGEKTLTAIALMFAVLKSKPTPFCILDEIEAALDETNIDTVASYIRSFAGPQFTLITHQKLTMEYADVLYGVTMPESGITQILSLKLGDDFEVQ